MLLLDSELAQLMTPQGQFGIAVRGGIDFMIHSIRLQIERYMQPRQETRAMLSLDLINAWNNASREKARDVMKGRKSARVYVDCARAGARGRKHATPRAASQ